MKNIENINFYIQVHYIRKNIIQFRYDRKMESMNFYLVSKIIHIHYIKIYLIPWINNLLGSLI